MHDKKDNNKSNTFIQGLRPFSKSLPHGLKKLLKKGSYNFSNIVDNWAKMVGKDLSNACYPSTVKMGKEMSNGILVLNVIHGNEITVEYGKQEIMDKINSFFGFKCIKEVKLKIVQEKKSLKKNFPLNENKSNYINKLENIKSEKFKETLNKLIEAYNAKNN
ncbi:MAG: DUF721 domain-containing protein [Pelagibacteraceae bacterium]|jgi:hypothetical protein|nr:DUF721 domain-containing protein [Pelagibacteraceae bacterium]